MNTNTEITAEQAAEREVVDKLVTVLISKGYALRPEEAEDWSIVKQEVLDALFQTDADNIQIRHHSNPDQERFVYLVYGNSPWEVIADHSTALTEDLKEVEAFADEVEARFN